MLYFPQLSVLSFLFGLIFIEVHIKKLMVLLLLFLCVLAFLPLQTRFGLSLFGGRFGLSLFGGRFLPCTITRTYCCEMIDLLGTPDVGGTAEPGIQQRPWEEEQLTSAGTLPGPLLC